MVDGIKRVGNKLTITRGTRTVATTDGTLVLLSPTLIKLNRSVSFPEFLMDYYYHWAFETGSEVNNHTGEIKMNFQTWAQVYFTVPPQETEVVYKLMQVPAGVDFDMLRVRLTRTKAPASTWRLKPIGLPPKTGQWIGWEGSAIIEQMRGMVRIMHLVVEAGWLSIVLQQSVAVAPGGWGAHGSASPVRRGDAGTLESYGAKQGIPVWSSLDFYKISNVEVYPQRISGVESYSVSDYGRYKVDGSKKISTARPSSLSYLSTYTVEIEAQLGRRS